MKINSLVSTLSKTFFGLALLTSTLYANHDNPSSEQKRFLINEEINDADFSKDEKEDTTSDENQEENSGKNVKTLNKKSNRKWVSFNTSYEGAIHYTPNISPLGNYIELDDGSVWQVRDEHRHCVLDWWTNERLIVVPNRSWFSSYYYSIINLEREISIDVQLDQACSTEYCVLRVIDINKGEVALSDGSIWQVGSSTLRDWKIYDAVIIGINSGYFSSSYPNILINVRDNDYVIANCIYQ